MLDEAGNTELSTPAYEGKFELCSSDVVRGWVWDKNNEQAALVSIVVDGRAVCTVVADQARTDLATDAKRRGQCGFCLTLPKWCCDGRVHKVRATVLHTNPEIELGEFSVRLSPRANPTQKQVLSSTVFVHPRHNDSGAKILTARALVGKKNWLFLADDSNRVRDQISGRYNISGKFLDDYKRVFDQREKRFAALGIPYFFFSAPTKEIICQDRLPEGMSVDHDNFPLTKIQNALAQDGFELRSLEKDIREEDNLNHTYFKTDTHWNHLGAHRAYVSIIKAIESRIGCGTPYLQEDFHSKMHKAWIGDLGNKEKVAYIGPDDHLVPCAPTAFNSDAFQEDVEVLMDASGDVTDSIIDPILNVSESRPTVVKTHANRTLPRAVIVRDSFTTALIPMLARNFSRSVFLWKADMIFPVIEMERPDVVIQIMVDRFIVRPPINVGC